MLPHLQWPRGWRRIQAPASPWFLVAPLAAAFLLELCLHRYAYYVPSPARDLDAPFAKSCHEPEINAPRENATLVMLTRNSELAEAKLTVESVERAFNRWYHYPIMFLNDEPFDAEFVRQLNETSSGLATFEVIPQEQWTFPPSVDVEAARQSIVEQGKTPGSPYAGREGYHHMCRFFSGNFYRLEALKQYKWYWRLEPDVEFSCSITYDPFVQMAKNNKVYGFVIALWEVGNTCPSLFRATADWMEAQSLAQTSLWKAMIEASWLPWPFRNFMNFLSSRYRDRHGDVWSLCHYWSNFEIANLDFFRGQQYQDLFEHLDRQGGFYFERWGDAAVHSLAVAMLLQPEQVHHFDDVGYRHGKFYQCPANAMGGQLYESKALGHEALPEGNPEQEGGVGCRCQCDRRPDGVRNFSGYCMSRLKKPATGRRPWVPRLMYDKEMRPFRAFVVVAVLSWGCVLVFIGHRWIRHLEFGL